MNIETTFTESHNTDSHDEYSNTSAIIYNSFEQKEQKRESSSLSKGFTESSDEYNNTSEIITRKLREKETCGYGKYLQCLVYLVKYVLQVNNKDITMSEKMVASQLKTIILSIVFID